MTPLRGLDNEGDLKRWLLQQLDVQYGAKLKGLSDRPYVASGTANVIFEGATSTSEELLLDFDHEFASPPRFVATSSEGGARIGMVLTSKDTTASGCTVIGYYPDGQKPGAGEEDQFDWVAVL